jgi:flagellar hook-length control protein FliK
MTELAPACISPPKPPVTAAKPAARKPAPDAEAPSFEKVLKAKEKEKKQVETEAAKAASTGTAAPASQPDQAEPAGRTDSGETGVNGLDPAKAPAAQAPVAPVKAGGAQAQPPVEPQAAQPGAGEAVKSAAPASDGTKTGEILPLDAQPQVQGGADEGAPALDLEKLAQDKPSLTQAPAPASKDGADQLKPPSPANDFTQVLQALGDKLAVQPQAAAPAAQTAPAQAVESKPADKPAAGKPAVDVDAQPAQGAQGAQPAGAVDKGAAAYALQANPPAKPAEALAGADGRPPLQAAQAADAAGQVARQIDLAVQQGRNTLRMQLRPAELGAIDIRLHTTGQGVNVTVLTEQASTGRLLEAQLSQLRQSLADAGVQLAHVNIGQGAPGQHNGGFDQQSPRPDHSLAHESTGENGERKASALPVRPLLGATGGIDYRI